MKERQKRVKKKKIFSKKLPAFSLIELSIVLMIIGLIAGAVFKGKDLMESARLRSVLNDVERYRLAVHMYRDTYGEWPGDDPKAQSRFGSSISNGNGDGVVTGQDKTYVWPHLAKAGQVSSDTAPSSKMGGKFQVISNIASGMNGTWLILAGDTDGTTGILSPKQAQALKAKGEDGPPNQGNIRILDSSSQSGQCLSGQTYQLNNDVPACVVAVSLS